MNAIKSHNRRNLIATAAILFVVLGAYGFARLHPPLGPIEATIAPQHYVRSVTDGNFPKQGRFVLVDAASARLFMIEDGHVRDTMRVIVGKPAAATPEIKSMLNYATFNPYWNVPPDLAQKIIAPRVLKDGPTYLTERGYEIVSGFGDDAQVLSPATVDWAAVNAGDQKVYVRQRPGPANSMGHMKFTLLNERSIYLHDTPNKDLFAKADRSLSNGCVRLEDAPRFARWLLGNNVAVSSSKPEQRVALPDAVPITIAYLDSDAQMQLAGLQ